MQNCDKNCQCIWITSTMHQKKKKWMCFKANAKGVVSVGLSSSLLVLSPHLNLTGQTPLTGFIGAPFSHAICYPKASLFGVHALRATIQNCAIIKRHHTREVLFGAQRIKVFHYINSWTLKNRYSTNILISTLFWKMNLAAGQSRGSKSG